MDWTHYAAGTGKINSRKVREITGIAILWYYLVELHIKYRLVVDLDMLKNRKKNLMDITPTDTAVG